MALPVQSLSRVYSHSPCEPTTEPHVLSSGSTTSALPGSCFWYASGLAVVVVLSMTFQVAGSLSTGRGCVRASTSTNSDIISETIVLMRTFEKQDDRRNLP